MTARTYTSGATGALTLTSTGFVSVRACGGRGRLTCMTRVMPPPPPGRVQASCRKVLPSTSSMAHLVLNAADHLLKAATHAAGSERGGPDNGRGVRRRRAVAHVPQALSKNSMPQSVLKVFSAALLAW